MILLLNFLQSFIFLFVFILFYFLLDRLIQQSQYMKISIPQYAYDFIFGILIGILNLIFFYIFSSKNNEFNITFYFIGAIILASFKNYQSALYSSAPLLIYQLLKFDIQPTTYFIISVTFIGV